MCCAFGCQSPKVQSVSSQREQNEKVIYYVENFLEDYFWIHEKLPDSFSQIAKWFEPIARGFRPSPNAAISWALISQKVPDEVYGGRVSVVRVKVIDGGVATESDVAVDLRDPMRVWKYHVAESPDDLKVPRERVAKNLANAVAIGIYKLHVLGKVPTWEALSRDDDSRVDLDCVLAIQEGARNKLTFQITPEEIKIAVIDTTACYHYPLIGPKAFNESL